MNEVILGEKRPHSFHTGCGSRRGSSCRKDGKSAAPTLRNHGPCMGAAVGTGAPAAAAQSTECVRRQYAMGGDGGARPSEHSSAALWRLGTRQSGGRSPTLWGAERWGRTLVLAVNQRQLPGSEEWQLSAEHESRQGFDPSTAEEKTRSHPQHPCSRELRSLSLQQSPFPAELT